jgi:hypothetical protein
LHNAKIDLIPPTAADFRSWILVGY